MLLIQKFIHEHPDIWEQCLSAEPYCLKIKRSDFANGRYVMFNYNMIESDNYNLIVSESRGLILDSQNNFKIVRKGFNRFFNYEEGPAAKIDWNEASATIKEDGTLLFLSYYDNRWIWGTKQNFDAFKAELSNIYYPTFGELLNSILEKYYPNVMNNIEMLGQKCTLCFELCSRHNRIVIDYPEPKLFLLAKFDNDTGDEFSQNLVDADARYMKVDRPKYYKMSSIDDYKNIVEDFGVQHEGLVVLDKNGNRIKMKSKLYFQLHKQITNGAMDLEAIVSLVRKGDDAEFLSYFPDYKNAFESVKDQIYHINDTIKNIHKLVDQYIHDGITRKDFAIRIKNSPLAALYFKAWDGKLSDDFIANLSNDRFINIFQIKI